MAEYLAVLRRRKWLFLLALAIVPLSAVLFSLRQDRMYEASAEVLLSQENLAASLTGVANPSFDQPAERVAQTQAQLARVPTVVEATLRAARVSDRSVRDFLKTTEVNTRVNSDLLEFRVRDAVPELATRLATEYAQQFTLYRRTLDTAAIVAARVEVETRIHNLKAAGERRSALYATLLEKEQQLSTMEALKTSNASLVRNGSEAKQVQPRPVRNGLLGLALGLLLGVGLAFLREAFDTRPHSSEDIARRLDLPLLARLSEPPRKLRKKDKLVMLEAPHGAQAEEFRMLRTNLEFSRRDRNVRTIMVTSAVEREGKSTTAANLAVALVRAGQRVVLVDLDLRRPFIDRFFQLHNAWGITQLVLDHTSLGEALLTPVRLNAPQEPARRFGHSGVGEELSGDEHGHGALHVIPSGPVPPDPGEFVGTKALHEVLGRLRDQADVVLIDAPPLLHVGDAMALSGVVDGVIVVARINVVRNQMLDEARRLLETVPAQKVGFVLTAAEAEEGYGYGGTYYYDRSNKRTVPMEKVR